MKIEIYDNFTILFSGLTCLKYIPIYSIKNEHNYHFLSSFSIQISKAFACIIINIHICTNSTEICSRYLRCKGKLRDNRAHPSGGLLTVTKTFQNISDSFFPLEFLKSDEPFHELTSKLVEEGKLN